MGNGTRARRIRGNEGCEGGNDWLGRPGDWLRPVGRVARPFFAPAASAAQEEQRAIAHFYPASPPFFSLSCVPLPSLAFPSRRPSRCLSNEFRRTFFGGVLVKFRFLCHWSSALEVGTVLVCRRHCIAVRSVCEEEASDSPQEVSYDCGISSCPEFS